MYILNITKSRTRIIKSTSYKLEVLCDRMIQVLRDQLNVPEVKANKISNGLIDLYSYEIIDKITVTTPKGYVKIHLYTDD